MNSLAQPNEEAKPPAAAAKPPAAAAPTTGTLPVSVPAPAAKSAPPVLGTKTMPAISVKGLSVYFGRHQVLKNVSLEAKANAVTAIIGPSGCGKSNVNPVAQPHARNWSRKPAWRAKSGCSSRDIYNRAVEPVIVRRRVGMVFQKSNPFPTMSIAENVCVGLRLNGVRGRALLAERTGTPCG